MSFDKFIFKCHPKGIANSLDFLERSLPRLQLNVNNNNDYIDNNNNNKNNDKKNGDIICFCFTKTFFD